jgi:hypothetical protein
MFRELCCESCISAFSAHHGQIWVKITAEVGTEFKPLKPESTQKCRGSHDGNDKRGY